MATETLTSVEEYLRTDYQPNAEYINGALRPKALGTRKHAELEGWLCSLIKQRGYRAFAELTLPIAATRFLIPDVVADKVIADPYPDRPVLLCVEILSPGDRIGATLAKCEEYHAWGVSHCWVIDPESRIAWQYDRGGRPVERNPGDRVSAGEIAIPLAEIFAILD